LAGTGRDPFLQIRPHGLDLIGWSNQLRLFVDLGQQYCAPMLLGHRREDSLASADRIGALGSHLFRECKGFVAWSKPVS
jgi:hypothetical protein